MHETNARAEILFLRTLWARQAFVLSRYHKVVRVIFKELRIGGVTIRLATSLGAAHKTKFAQPLLSSPLHPLVDHRLPYLPAPAAELLAERTANMFDSEAFFLYPSCYTMDCGAWLALSMVNSRSSPHY